MKKVALIHTTPVTVEPLNELCHKVIPGVELVNILDDSLLKQVIENKKITKPVIRRMLKYFKASEDYKVDVIFNTCSSVGEVADIGRKIIDTPIVKIDEPMARTAVKMGKKIGVAATLPTTLAPTSRMIEKVAKNTSKDIEIKTRLCKGAFEKLKEGRQSEHDEIVSNHLKELLNKVDIVVLAQGSMARVIPMLDSRKKEKILTSPLGGVKEVKRILEI